MRHAGKIQMHFPDEKSLLLLSRCGIMGCTYDLISWGFYLNYLVLVLFVY